MTTLTPETIPEILIVDDNEDSAQLMAAMARMNGYRATIRYNGASALEYCRKQEVDLVLLDVVLPDANGFELAAILKNIYKNDCFVPIIMVTALSAVENRVTGLTNADGFLEKPFSSEELLAQVRVMLRIRNLHIENKVARQRYQRLYERFPAMHLALNCQNKIVDCSLLLLQWLSIDKSEIVGCSAKVLFDKKDHETLDTFLQMLLNGRSLSIPPVFLMGHHKPDTPDTQVRVSGVNLRDLDPEISVYLALEDVTEKMRLEELEKIARRHLYRSARLSAIGTLASGVAHELNNPLTAILGFAGSFLGRLRKSEPIKIDDLEQGLDIINAEAVRCRDIVANLSQFAREGEPLISVFSLRDSVKDVLMLLGPRARKKNVVLMNNIEPDVTVLADRRKLDQVFMHVLSNCIDFAQEKVTATVLLKPQDVFYNHVLVHIIDDGPGIAPEILPKIFDPFFTTKSVGQGMGLGLAQCHHLMEECDGGIDIVSEPGKGTSVTLEIPRMVPQS